MLQHSKIFPRVSCTITSVQKSLRGNTSQQRSSTMGLLRLQSHLSLYLHAKWISYLEIPTQRHMWNWEWFSVSTGSHLHNPTTSHPHLKATLEPLCSLFPADQWDPDKTPTTKEAGFLGNFSQLGGKKKKIKGRPFTADLFWERFQECLRGGMSGLRERDEGFEKKEEKRARTGWGEIKKERQSLKLIPVSRRASSTILV